MQEATLFQFGEEVKFVAGSNGVKHVFPDEKNGQTLIVVYEDEIVKYTGIPFVHTNPRKEKEEDK